MDDGFDEDPADNTPAAATPAAAAAAATPAAAAAAPAPTPAAGSGGGGDDGFDEDTDSPPAAAAAPAASPAATPAAAAAPAPAPETKEAKHDDDEGFDDDGPAAVPAATPAAAAVAAAAAAAPHDSDDKKGADESHEFDDDGEPEAGTSGTAAAAAGGAGGGGSQPPSTKGSAAASGAASASGSRPASAAAAATPAAAESKSAGGSVPPTPMAGSGSGGSGAVKTSDNGGFDPDDPRPPELSRSIQDPNYVPVHFSDSEDAMDDIVIPGLNQKELDDLEEVRLEVEAAAIPDRLKQMQKEFEDQTIMVGSLDLEDVKKQEAELEKGRIASVQEELERYRKRQEELLLREIEARKRLMAERETQVTEQRKEATLLMRRSLVGVKDQQAAFRKVEDRLKAALADQQGTVRVEFGELDKSDTNTIRGRRYGVDWDKAPRLVCIKHMQLRAVKNKIPPGRYVMLVTLFDRLGGTPVRWSRLKDFNYYHRTKWPVRHLGRFHDIEMNFTSRSNKVRYGWRSEGGFFFLSVFCYCCIEARRLLFLLFCLRLRPKKKKE